MASYRVLSATAFFFCCAGSLASLPSQTIPFGYYQVAAKERVPAEALYSLALTESSKQLAHGVLPWPWTLNIAGKSYRYGTRQEAYQALLAFMRRYPLKRIDVGIAQVNMGWNGHHFRSSWEAFDPYLNLHVAARILRACYDAKPGSWITATGCYHHPAGGEPAQKYQMMVTRHLNRLQPVSGMFAPNTTEPVKEATP